MTFDAALDSLGKHDQLYELYPGTVVIERRNEDGTVRKKDIVSLKRLARA